METKKGISLIVLVLTVIVLSILATAVIITLNNTNIMSEARKTTFKSDMSSFKEAYELYKVGLYAENPEYDQTQINVVYGDDTFKAIFGENVSEKYSSLQIVGGELVYQTTDEMELEIAKELGMLQESNSNFISKDNSYVGSFVDTNGDNVADGVIFADLCVGGSGSWGGKSYTIPTIDDKTTIKEYSIVQASYEVEGAEGFGEHPLLVAEGSGTERFYIMSLTDYKESAVYFWSSSSYSTHFTEAQCGFGKGENSTEAMAWAWTYKTYGAKDDCSVWTYVGEGSHWFVPSDEEWAAFGALIGDKVTGDNASLFGLKGRYWSSSQYTDDTGCVIAALFEDDNSIGLSVGISTLPAYDLGAGAPDKAYIRLADKY